MFIPADGAPLGAACPSCTSIIDAIDGVAPHIAQQINLAVVAKAPIAQFREHARTRGWRNVRLLSSAATTGTSTSCGRSGASSIARRQAEAAIGDRYSSTPSALPAAR